MLNEYSFEDIYIRHAVDDYPDDRYFTMHIHEQCEIYFFLSGSVEYLVEGSKYPLSENSLMIMRPSEVHKPKITNADRYERYAINFPLSFADDIDIERRLLKPFTERDLGKNNMLSDSEFDSELVKKHLFEDISVPTLAEHFYLSPSQFSRIFKQATGAAPWEYITKKRLTAAKEKIRSGFSAQMAAESCGFGDYSAFYRAYTKHFGVKPTG